MKKNIFLILISSVLIFSCSRIPPFKGKPFLNYAKKSNNEINDDFTCNNNICTFQGDTVTYRENTDCLKFITPNGDGKNDVVILVKEEGDVYDIKIYNNAKRDHSPKGDIIYESSNYQNDYAFDNEKDGKYLIEYVIKGSNSSRAYTELYVVRETNSLHEKSKKYILDQIDYIVCNAAYQEDPLLEELRN